MNKTYNDKMHRIGKIWSILALLALLSVPTFICIMNDAWPSAGTVLSALLKVAPLYYVTAVIEVITYTPMLGVGGTYLSFVTGNITNLKMPCALNAMNAADVKSNSDEGEVISTISIGASSITTTIIIAVGVLAFGSSGLLNVIQDPNSVVSPAFNNVIPALFGALLGSYLKKYWKIATPTIVIGVIILLFVPSIGAGTLLFPTIIAAIASVFVLDKLGILERKN
ncbi:MAG: hypothetical protein KIG53_04440 [Oscillospiraceae bacterium]|nr:hypothetical protein [Oscillospiraceae bacterium]